jgi:hypothetical protein
MPYQIMYSSQATEPMAAPELEKILSDARAGNEARNVTGVLVYVDGVFFQILEGDQAVLRNLIANIARDTRHRSVKVFHEAQVDVRAFESWSMAYLAPTAQEISTWAGLPATATVEEVLAEVNRYPERVPRTLITALKVLLP